MPDMPLHGQQLCTEESTDDGLRWLHRDAMELLSDRDAFKNTPYVSMGMYAELEHQNDM